MQKTIETKYLPFEKQVLFHQDTHKFVLFGGSKGPGKSRALTEEAMNVCTINDDGTPRKDGRGFNAIILRTSLTELKGSIICHFLTSDWYAKGLAAYDKQDKIATFPNGATLRFGYASNMDDMLQYFGTDYSFIGWDELGLVKDFKMFLRMVSCLRNPDPKVKCRLKATANPAGVGHAWVKALFVDGKPCAGMDEKQYEAAKYSYIPAKYLDGPFANDADYLENLRMQPEAIQRAWIDGDWNVAAGAYFDHWNASTMTISNQAFRAMYRTWWKTWISIDWGFKHSSAVYWHALAPDGTIYTFDEWVFEKTGSWDAAEEIARRSEGYKISNIWLSPDAKQKRDDINTSRDQFNRVFNERHLPFAQDAKTTPRTAGWAQMYQLLASGEWKVVDCCKEAMTAIPAVLRSEKDINDILKTDNVSDDVVDSLRYGIHSQFPDRVSKKPLSVARREDVSAQPNMNRMMMRDLIWQEKHEKQLKAIQNIGRFKKR